MGWRSRRSAWIIALGTGLVSCAATKDVTPPIEISPGAAARIAQMDRFRLHDEDRKHMMQRPRVWVEEVPDEETSAADGGVTGAPNEEEPTSAPTAPSTPP